ncbi:MAG: polysaccharide biosynthesis protein [Chloroflexi bacterium HGW-Chloroflexi-10]|nr:MAG: polysaccharide biosynthesis protein [Chloroflexi bacterium HGW-Chloroflexi-10]
MKGRPNFRNKYVLLLDIVLIFVAVLGSYALRFELGPLFFQYISSAIWMVAVSLVIKPLIYYWFGLYRRMWMYASVQELKLIIIAVTAASVAVSAVMVGLLSVNVFRGFPRAVLVLDWILSLMMVGGLRFSLRVIGDNLVVGSAPIRTHGSRRLLIVGAGDAGALVVRELQKNPQMNSNPVGFLDDNPSKLKQQIHGVPVVGLVSDLSKVLENLRIDEVIIAIPSAPGRIVRLVADICRVKNMPFRTMPGIYELLGGTVSVSRLREVDIADLLRRQPTHMGDELIGATISGKTILVTGAGGSIGKELCRQIARWGPSGLILVGHGENSIFEALLDLKESFPGLSLTPIISDMRDKKRLDTIFERHRPQVVFHAAAHKHVPMMELNVEEAVTNNILGTRNLVDVVEKYKVERLLMISTDKAIRPKNVMGATKRIAEMLVLDAARRSNKPYCVVRFGNVLGSRGSVVPIFKRQIAKGGPITITHPDMKRYFMTIPEAVYLVLQSASIGKGGETFVLNMGDQVRIVDLAEDLIRLSGLEPGRDVEIVFTGSRPGEKLSEDLWDEDFTFQRTDHPDIYHLAGQDEMQGVELQDFVNHLVKLSQQGDGSGIITLFDEQIPGAQVRITPPEDMTSIN